MQISRHWRMNAQRYRLEGIRYQTGEVSLQERPEIAHNDDNGSTVQSTVTDMVMASNKEVAA